MENPHHQYSNTDIDQLSENKLERVLESIGRTRKFNTVVAVPETVGTNNH